MSRPYVLFTEFIYTLRSLPSVLPCLVSDFIILTKSSRFTCLAFMSLLSLFLEMWCVVRVSETAKIYHIMKLQGVLMKHENFLSITALLFLLKV